MTKQFLKDLYNEYNQTYFNNELGKCSFRFFTKKSKFLGWYQKKNDKNNKSDDRIWINVCLEQYPENLKLILIHEMVHMYVNRIIRCRYTGIFGHGKCFRKKCKEIKNVHNIDVYLLPHQYKKSILEKLEWILFRLIDR